MSHSLIKSSIMLSTALLAASCASKSDDASIIERPDYRSASGIFDIEALEALGRVSNPVASPDGRSILFGIAYESVEQNRSNNEIYVVDIPQPGAEVAEPRRLTRSAESENGAVWIAGGDKIAFMAKDSDGSTQLWTMNADGSGRRCVSSVEGGIEGFLFSPDESRVVVIRTIKNEQVRSGADIYPDLPKSNAHVVDDLMYKHWDTWVTEIPHPFVADFDGNTLSNLHDIIDGEPFEAPMRPFGGAESFAWSPDGKSLVYVCRKKTGKEYAVSTNSDLYLYDFESNSTRNLTEGMMGYDTNPVYSPDGRYLAWLSMERDGYEADKNRVFILDLQSGVKTDLTADWDYTADAIAWAPDSRSILMLAPYHGTIPIFRLDLDTREVTRLTFDERDYAAICPLPDGSIASMRHSFTAPNELCLLRPRSSSELSDNSEDSESSEFEISELTAVNQPILSQLRMPAVERHMVATTDGREMLAWVLLPPDFDPNGSYPAILYCQGGPQSPVSQFWSYRWNLALMASQGYVVIAPNRRGLPGFGTEWNEQISKDYPGQNMRDYLAAADHLRSLPYVDASRVGAVGASYGGFSVYWLAGNHDGRFACLIAHAGIFNTEAQYLETEEMWFADWDMGGPYWIPTNTAALRTHSMSPHRFVDRWTAPILVTHGEYDFRILASQGMMAFNAARLRGIPAEMAIFPEENHWILRPQNAVLWQRLFFRWLDRWLKQQN